MNEKLAAELYIIGCSANSYDVFSFFHFPSHPDIQERKLAGRKGENDAFTFVRLQFCADEALQFCHRPYAAGIFVADVKLNNLLAFEATGILHLAGNFNLISAANGKIPVREAGIG